MRPLLTALREAQEHIKAMQETTTAELASIPGLRAEVERLMLALKRSTDDFVKPTVDALTLKLAKADAVVRAAELYRDQFRLEDDDATDAARDGLFTALFVYRGRV